MHRHGLILILAALILVQALLLAACASAPTAPVPGTPTNPPELPPAPTPTTLIPESASTLALKLLEAPGSIYQLVEFELLTDGVYANPFDPAEVDLQLRFTAPGGKTLSVPAFWYQDYDLKTMQAQGAPGWRARFTPTEPGSWTAQAVLTASEESASQPLESNTIGFYVTPTPDAAGFIRRHPHDPRYLAFDNGETFFPVGINIGWGGSRPLEDYQRWLDRLSANGGTLIRVWMASWSFGIEWKDTGLGDYTNRLQRAWLLDQVFRLAEARGVSLELVLLNHGAFSATVNPEWVDNPYNAANGGPCATPADFAADPLAHQLFQRRLRYIAARWAYSPSLMAWEWWNEADWTPITNPDMAAWIQAMTPLLKQYDPYNHLISTSYAQSSNPEIAALPEIDFAQLHLYSSIDPAVDFPDMYQDWTAAVPGKPVLFAEFGASVGGEDERSDDRQGLHLHNAIWASTFSGYASTAMYWWWDSYVDPLDLWSVFGRLSRFLDGEDMVALQPGKAVLSSREIPYQVLQNDHRLLVWLHDRRFELNALQRERGMAGLTGQTLPVNWVYLPPAVSGLTLKIINLQDGAYRAYWYSPHQGQWLQAVELQVSGGEATLSVPDFQGDLALKVLPANEVGPELP